MRLSLASQRRELGQRGRIAQYWTDGRKMNGWRTRNLTMGPVLGRRKLTGRLMMCWVPLKWDRAGLQLSGHLGPEVTSGTADSTRRGGADATTKGATEERGSLTEGTSGNDRWNGVGPWGPNRTADRYCWSEPANRRVVTSGHVKT